MGAWGLLAVGLWAAAACGGGNSTAAFACPTSRPGPNVAVYVAPNGRNAGAGTIGDPWDLATALGCGELGDTVWLRGTYGGGTVSIPMDGVQPLAPLGRTTWQAPKTGPGFDVFLVTSTP